MPLSTGQVLHNRYRIVKLLGQGGFGAVYRAWDVSLNRPCAVKENLDTSPDAQRQFVREAQILANLSHPNLPRVTDHFSISGMGQYLVMDFIVGEDLQDLLDRIGGPLLESQVVDWINQICDALSYLHNQNPPIVHRDVKPANIRITPDGNAMLVDFGIAKAYSISSKTTKGARAVMPGFSPLEQYGHGRTDARSDVYALGATMYTLLTKQVPPDSVDRARGAVLTAVCQRNPTISGNLETAILKALEIRQEDRFQTIAEFRATFISSSSQQPEKPLLRRFSLIGLVLFGVVGFLSGMTYLVNQLMAPSILPISSSTWTPRSSPTRTSTIEPTIAKTSIPTLSITLIPAAEGTPDPSDHFEYLGELATDWEDGEPYSPGYYIYHANGDPDIPIIVSMGWCATTQSILDKNWPMMGYELTIDGISIDLEEEMGFRSWTAPDIGPCYGYAGLTTGWSRGEYHVIWTHTIYQLINDGSSDYEAGDYVMDIMLTIP